MLSVKSVLPLLALAAITHTAHAQDAEDPPPPPVPGAPVPLYTAPLAQQTQTTYVPQSVALSGPDEIDAEEGRRAPLGYTPVLRARKGLLIGGGVTLGVSYMYAALLAAIGEDEARNNYNYNYNGTSGTNQYAAMWIPVAGPFIQLANTDSATGRVFLAGFGAAELTGAIMLYYGLTTKKTVYVRNDLVSNVRVSPMASANGGTGFALSGNF